MADPRPYKVATSGDASAAPIGAVPIALYGADSGGPATVAWGDVTAKPATFPSTWATVSSKPAVIASGADQAAARASIGAGTSNLNVGPGSADAKAGNYTPPNATAATKGLVNQAAAQANSAATDAAGVVTDFNALLAKLRTAGILAP